MKYLMGIAQKKKMDKKYKRYTAKHATIVGLLKLKDLTLEI